MSSTNSPPLAPSASPETLKLQRQVSTEFPSWYTLTPDADVWGEEEEEEEEGGDGWGAEDTGNSNGGWGDLIEDDGATGNDYDNDFDTGEVEATRALLSYSVLQLDKVDGIRNKLLEKWADLLDVDVDQIDSLMRFLLYQEKDMERLLTDEKFHEKTRVAAGVTNKNCHTSIQEEAKHTVAVCGAYCDDEPKPITEMEGLNCGHYLCKECWQGFLEAELEKGRECIFSRCPCMNMETGEKCQESVPFSLWQSILSKEVLDTVRNWILNNFVDCRSSMQWCTGADCGRVIHSELASVDVLCHCGERFCFKCMNPAHQPCPCDLAKKWTSAADDDETLTQKWLAAMTKKCPKCGTRIEKNRACNHMACSNCKHNFCWLCLQPFSGPGGKHPSWYVCNVIKEEQTPSMDLEAKAKQESKKQLSLMARARPKVDDCIKDKLAAQALLLQLNKHEPNVQVSLVWMRNLIHQIIVSQTYLEWSYVVLYFGSTCNKKEFLEDVLKILEENTDGTMHDIERVLKSSSSLHEFLEDQARVRQIKKAEVKLQQIIRSVEEQVSLLLPAITGNDPDPNYPYWHCLRCTMRHKKSGKSKTCSSCQACREHSDFDCKHHNCRREDYD